MKVLIEEFNSENNTVIFSSQYGKGFAFWEGDEPEINAYYGVDIEIPELLVWEKDIKRDKFTNYTITCHENITYFVGKLESASEDGCCIVRVGDSIVLLETEETPFENGTYISFCSKEVTLYNSDI